MSRMPGDERRPLLNLSGAQRLQVGGRSMALARSGSSQEASDRLRLNPLQVPHLKAHQSVKFAHSRPPSSDL